MTEWLRLVNEIRSRPPETLLTPSQNAVLKDLVDLLTVPQRISLCGPPGVGKTFVAWAVARLTGAVHVALPEAAERLPPGTTTILIDNAPGREEDVRRLIAICGLHGVGSLVFISREPVQMPMRRVVLDYPTADDWHVIESTAGRLGAIVPAQRQRDLWAFLHACCL